MFQFVRRVAWVRACIDAAESNDAENKDWIVEVVERVD